MSAGTMTGVRGPRCNRGWRRRETPATKAPAPRNLVRRRTLGCVSPKGRTAVERRQASAPCRVRACLKGKQVDPRLSAFCFLFYFSVRSFFRAPPLNHDQSGSPHRIDLTKVGCGVVLGMACRIARTRKKSRRENGSACLSSRPIGGVRVRHTRRTLLISLSRCQHHEAIRCAQKVRCSPTSTSST